MRVVLFCENRYAIDILQPLQTEIDREGKHTALWYVHAPKIKNFTLDGKVEWTDSIQKVYDYKPDAIFVPGNIVPYYTPVRDKKSQIKVGNLAIYLYLYS